MYITYIQYVSTTLAHSIKFVGEKYFSCPNIQLYASNPPLNLTSVSKQYLLVIESTTWCLHQFSICNQQVHQKIILSSSNHRFVSVPCELQFCSTHILTFIRPIHRSRLIIKLFRTRLKVLYGLTNFQTFDFRFLIENAFFVSLWQDRMRSVSLAFSSADFISMILCSKSACQVDLDQCDELRTTGN